MAKGTKKGGDKVMKKQGLGFWGVLFSIILAIVMIAAIVAIVGLILANVHGVRFDTEIQSWFKAAVRIPSLIGLR